VSYVRDLPDGRRFANDSRGLLYLIDANNEPHVYADVAAPSPTLVYNRLESGFIGFVFHLICKETASSTRSIASEARGIRKYLNFIPIGYGFERRNLSKRHHGVARNEPGSQYVRGQRGARCFASPTSSPT